MSSSLVAKLTAEGTGESAGFLNDIAAGLWPNANIAISKIIRESVDPLLKTSLPYPLSNLQFTKVDLGPVPVRFSDVKANRLETGSIELDMNLDWEGDCDMELDGPMVPAVGVEKIKLRGRLSILLCPLTNVIPLIGAAQITFVNPPVLQLDFTGAANIADFSVLHGTVHGIVMGLINSMFTLPNRYLVKMDLNNDWFKTYLYPLGVIRLTVEKAWGFAEEAKSTTSKIFAKLTGAAPDCYVKVDVGGEEQWKTSVKSNTTSPAWNETHDFVVSDWDQCIKLDVYDYDLNAADHIGLGVTTVRELLLAGNTQELPLVLNDEEIGGKISAQCEFFDFVAEGSSFTAAEHQGDSKFCGICVVLIAGAAIKGQREELSPSVVITWGEKHRFQTTVITDAPGVDINNPSFDQVFRIPVLAGDDSQNFQIALLNGEKEMGKVEVPFKDVLNAPDMTLQHHFEVGNAETVRASFCLLGLKRGDQKGSLPTRPKPEEAAT